MPKGNSRWDSVNEEYVLVKSDNLEKAIGQKKAMNPRCVCQSTKQICNMR